MTLEMDIAVLCMPGQVLIRLGVKPRHWSEAGRVIIRCQVPGFYVNSHKAHFPASNSDIQHTKLTWLKFGLFLFRLCVCLSRSHKCCHNIAIKCGTNNAYFWVLDELWILDIAIKCGTNNIYFRNLDELWILDVKYKPGWKEASSIKERLWTAQRVTK